MTKSIKINLAGIDVEVPIPKGLKARTREFMKGIRFAAKVELPPDETAQNAERAIDNLKPNTPPRIIIAYVNKAMPRHPAIRLAHKLQGIGQAKAGVKSSRTYSDKAYMMALSNAPFWAGVIAAGNALIQSDFNTEKFDSEQWERLSQKAMEVIGYEGQNEPSAFKRKLALRKARRTIFGESINRKKTMNVENINSILVKAISQIQENELQNVQEQRFVIGGSGLEEPEGDNLHLQKNTVYYMGASSSPDLIMVTEVGKDRVRWQHYPFGKKGTTSVNQLWIAKDLIAKGTSTWLKSGSAKYDPKLAKDLKSLMAGKAVKPNAAPYQPVRIWAKAAEGVTDDLWREAEQYGGVGGMHDPKHGLVYEINSDMGSLKDLKKNKNFVIIKTKKE